MTNVAGWLSYAVYLSYFAALITVRKTFSLIV